MDADVVKSDKDLPSYTLDEVKEHDCDEDCWIVIDNKVYDITTYLDYHPGGKVFVLQSAGQEATQKFNESEHSNTARDLLKKYLIGVLAPSE